MTPTPDHLTPAAQLVRFGRLRDLLPRLTQRDVTVDELEEAAAVLDMVRDDLRDRIAGRAPHPITGRKKAMR